MATLKQRITELEQRPNQNSNAFVLFVKRLALNLPWVNLGAIKKRNQG